MAGNFWANKLASPQPSAAPVQVSPPQPWFQPGTAPLSTSTPFQPQQAPTVTPGYVPPSVTSAPVPGTPISALLGQVEYHTVKAKSIQASGECPDCGSGNYFQPPAPAGRPAPAARCSACGYNPLFQHSTHGVSATTPGIPVHRARGQQANVNDASLQIVAHVNV